MTKSKQGNLVEVGEVKKLKKFNKTVLIAIY